MSIVTESLPPPGVPLGLVGDIGGTNFRLALVPLDGEPVRLFAHRAMHGADYPTAEAGLAAYLAAAGGAKPLSAVLAVAGPVHEGHASLTNSHWRLDEAALQSHLGIRRVRMVNDFAVFAFATLVMKPDDVAPIGPLVVAREGRTIAAMGPGTGFGLAALAGGNDVGLLVTEGGHISFAPGDEEEIEILRVLRRRFGHVSVERILSGQGLMNLHAALEQIGGHGASGLDAAAITAAASRGETRASATVARFCGIMASTAGDLALALGAEGGVFLAGGIMPRLLQLLDHAAFRARFEDKGRFGSYLRAIPTQVITADDASLRGAARALVRGQ